MGRGCLRERSNQSTCTQCLVQVERGEPGVPTHWLGTCIPDCLKERWLGGPLL